MPTTNNYGSDEPIIIRVAPYTYIHILDTNTNVTRVLCGPLTYTRQDHEKIVLGPCKMITVPPRHYTKIVNPVQLDDEGDTVLDKHGQVKLRFGDEEIRLAGDPFPLYPGEQQDGEVTRLRVIQRNQALRLKATRDFEKHYAGDEWLFHGPGTYIPRVEVVVVGLERALVVGHSQALLIRAIRKCKDANGIQRKAGEEWLVREQGAYMASIDEKIVETISATVLTEKIALHLAATKTFTDVYGTQRKAGEEWLVTFDMAETHLTDVYEEVKGIVKITTLSSRQYCVVVNPVIDGVQKLGVQELRKGECSFFLKPGEELLSGICSVVVLQDDEALLLTAKEAFHDADDLSSTEENVPKTTLRKPGDLWMVYGPREYVPPCAVNVLETRKAIPLDKNEGIYIRDRKSGTVRAVIGQTYMLKPDEELWEKKMPLEVEMLLEKQALGQVYVPPAHYGGDGQDNKFKVKRDLTRVIQFRVPHNAAVQIYDFKTKSSRVIFGPDLVMIAPDEQFTILRLSGDKPKRPNVIKSLCLMLGPDFMTDIIVVETSDHARLKLTLAYNWHFDVRGQKERSENSCKIFSVRDFTGDACKAIASRVRGAVAAEKFDTFHKHSAKIIRGSVFGIKDGKVGDFLTFKANMLVITNVDIQSVEPVDQSTRTSLQKSVQLAIEITTKSQEAKARHEAYREEEQAKGLLEQQKLRNEADAEAQRKLLLELRAESNAVESSGQATAEARARAEAAKIEAQAEVTKAKLQAEATTIQTGSKLQAMVLKHEAELKHTKAMTDIELAKQKELADIETKKFENIVKAIGGADTITAIARAGPEMQAKLLGGLGLNGYLVTDGRSPINLFSTAKGLIGALETPDSTSNGE